MAVGKNLKIAIKTDTGAGSVLPDGMLAANEFDDTLYLGLNTANNLLFEDVSAGKSVDSGKLNGQAAAYYTNLASNHTATEYSILIAGSGGTVSSLTHGTSGYVLTSNGASADPTWQAAASAPNDFITMAGLTTENVSALSAGDSLNWSIGNGITFTGNNTTTTISVALVPSTTGVTVCPVTVDGDGIGITIDNDTLVHATGTMSVNAFDAGEWTA